ncbi:MAG: hypothetical protein MJZ25_05795 [Fibrobacter sp.]|nr:hypothetical protein [Fibrobacter sp.]
MSDKTKVDSKESKALRLFKRITAIPYLLVIVALLMPIANVSCNDDKVIASPNVYELASGLDLETALQEPAIGMLKKMETGNPKAIERFRTTIPNFPKMDPMPALYILLVGAILAAAFAWFTPLGSIALGMLTMVSMGAFYAKLAELLANMGIPLLSVDPGIGYNAATILIFIGTAMNLAVIIRPIVVELKARRAAKKSVKDKG